MHLRPPTKTECAAVVLVPAAAYALVRHPVLTVRALSTAARVAVYAVPLAVAFHAANEHGDSTVAPFGARRSATAATLHERHRHDDGSKRNRRKKMRRRREVSLVRPEVLPPGQPPLCVVKKCRRSVSASSKRIVAAAQKWRCAACTKRLPASYEVDHVRALCDGGTNDRANLQALCPLCHSAKTLEEQAHRLDG